MHRARRATRLGPATLLGVAGLAILVGIGAAPGSADAPLSSRAPTDCAKREPKYIDPAWTCRKASEWRGGCIPGAAFPTWGCLELDEDAAFCEGSAPLPLTVYLSTSSRTLDCRGRTIRHDFHPPEERRSGIRAPYERSLTDVTIRNCRIERVGAYGIDLKRIFRGQDLNGPMEGHRRILVDEVTIEDAGQAGIYVGQNSEAITIRNSTIVRAALGIYLEAGSSKAHIEGVTIRATRRREAIAVDSSFQNTIEKSVFRENKGGVYLYQNCGERFGQLCPIARTTTASRNVIQNNRFYGDDVRIASRQHRKLTPSFCLSDAKYWRDRASHNRVVENLFDGGELHVRDGPSFVERNVFTHGTRVVVGARPPRGEDEIALSGLLRDNVFANGSRLEWSQEAETTLESSGNVCALATEAAAESP